MTGWPHETKRIGHHVGFDCEYSRCKTCDDGALACGVCGEHVRDHAHRADGGVFFCRDCGVRLTARDGKWIEWRP